MANNDLIEKPKLGIFQKIRKFFLIRGINGEKYSKAPEYLKNDPEVIETLVSKFYNNISYLSEENALAYLGKNPEIFRDLGKNLQDRFLPKKPELFKYAYDFQQKSIIFAEKKYEYLRYLPIEEQLEYLTKQTSKFASVTQRIPYDTGISFRESSAGSISGNISGNIETSPEFFAKKLEFFDESVLFKAFEIQKEYFNESAQYSQNKEERNNYFNAKRFYSELDFSNLSQELKIKLALIDNRLLEKFDDETLVKFVNNNPLILNLISSKARLEIIKKNPSFIKLVDDYNERKNILYSCPDAKKYVDYKYRTFQDKQDNVDYNEVLKISTLGYDTYFSLSNITNSVRESNQLWEIAKTIPQALAVTGITDNFTSARKQGHVKRLFESKISNPTILEAIKQSKYFGYNSGNYDDMLLNSSICKVLTDEKLLQRCDPNKVAEFVKNPSIELMKDLIIDTYGENAKKVLDSRPNITFENIPNLKIFDEKIFEEFGEAVVHNQLTYDTKFSILLADFANHPEKIEIYKKFERITDGLFVQNSAGNEEKFKSYLEVSKFIENINEKDMTPERISALKIYLTDRKLPETRTIPLTSLDDLDNYVTTRNKMYDDALQKVTDPQDIKEILSKKFFGMSYGKSIDTYYRASSLNLSGMINYYSIDNLLNDKRTYESDLFNNDELDSIELASIISKIDDPKVLKELYRVLSERENVIGPVEFESIKQKIPLQYSRELVSQLLTPEKALEKISAGEEGISLEHGEDNVDVIRLQGIDFKIMMHSFISSTSTNSGLKIKYGTSKEDLWKYFEQGCSTISNCLIEPDMLNSCGSGTDAINFGFSNIDPRLIIGMSHHDAHVSHSIGNPDPYFEYRSVKMNYPEELLRKTAAQITGYEPKDQSHEYNEVAMYRNEQDPEKVTSENIGGKIMPDYIVVYGKSNNYHRELAKAFSKNGKPIPIIEIDRNSYLDNKYMRARKEDTEHKKAEKEDSELIKSVKNIADNSSKERE